jgi:hypothetical protein
MEKGKWKMKSGEFKMEQKKRQMENETWNIFHWIPFKCWLKFKKKTKSKKSGNKERTEILREFSWKRSGTFRDWGAPVAISRFPNTLKNGIKF